MSARDALLVFCKERGKRNRDYELGAIHQAADEKKNQPPTKAQ